LFLSGQPRPHPRGQGSNASQFWGFLAIYAYTLCRRTTKFHMVTRMERSLFWGQPRPHLKGTGPSAPQFWGFPSIHAYVLYRIAVKLDVVTHVGEVHVSWGQPHLTSKESCMGSSATQFSGFSSIYAYII